MKIIKKILNVGCCESTVNAMLTMNSDTNEFNTSRSSTETCNRFLLSASLLPDRGFLGWQVAISPDDGLSVFAISGSESESESKTSDGFSTNVRTFHRHLRLLLSRTVMEEVVHIFSHRHAKRQTM